MLARIAESRSIRLCRTEIELITGSVIAKAQNHNIATPVNEFVLNLIKALEANSINVAEMM